MTFARTATTRTATTSPTDASTAQKIFYKKDGNDYAKNL